MVEKQLNNKRSDHCCDNFFLHIANSKTMKRKRYLTDNESVTVKVGERVSVQQRDRGCRNDGAQ